MRRVASAWCAGPAAVLGVEAAWVEPKARCPASDCLALARSAMAEDRFDAALAWFRHAAALDASLVLPRVGATLCLARLGRESEAEFELAAAYAASQRAGEVDATLARLFLLAGDRGAALASARGAIEQDAAWASWLKEDRAFRPLRDHPAFLQTIGEI